MSSYIPNVESTRREMLERLGMSSFDELFSHIPEKVRLKKDLDIPDGKSEYEMISELKRLSSENVVFSNILRGAGAYDHYIPAIVKSVVSNENFLTAYTPYQPEISQGLLQSIFEYQTMICLLTGMDVSNASVYDGASACAEAVSMFKGNKKNKAVVSSLLNPRYIQTLMTYAASSGCEVVLCPSKEGRTDLDALSELIDEGVSCVLVQQPNYFGIIEDAEKIAGEAHKKGIAAVMCCNPFYLAVGQTPGECGFDAAVGEGQPLGLPLSFGGPYLGFMAVKEKYMRSLPGRIVGQTEDSSGRRAFVLTLQAREQHIRREKASSNICSNQALCALTAAVYLSAMGDEGMREVALQCHSKAVYAHDMITKIKGFEQVYKSEFFHEFVTKCPIDPEKLNKTLAQRNILGPLPVKEGLLWCFTEKISKNCIDEICLLLSEIQAIGGKEYDAR